MDNDQQAQSKQRRMLLPAFGLLVVILMTVQHYGSLVGEYCLWKCSICEGVLFDSDSSLSGPTVEIPPSAPEHHHRWSLKQGRCCCAAWSPGHWVGWAINPHAMPDPDDVFRAASHSHRLLTAAFQIH